MSETKKCTRCGRVLPIENYNKSSKSADGLQIYCRECQSELSKAYNRANAAKIAERRRERQQQKAAVDSAPKDEPTNNADVIRTSDGRTLRRVSDSCKPLEEYTSRDLLSELKRRGYVWADMYVKHKIEYSKI